MTEPSRAYSYRWISPPAELVVQGHSLVSLTKPSEQAANDDVEALIHLGNQLVSQGHHRRALANFERAYALIARLLKRSITDEVALRLSPDDTTGALLEAAVEAGRLGLVRGWDAAGVVSPAEPPAAWLSQIRRLDPRIRAPEDVGAVQALDVANAHATAGDLDGALAHVERGLALGGSAAAVALLRLTEGTILAATDDDRGIAVLDRVARDLTEQGMAELAAVAASNAANVRAGAPRDRRVPAGLEFSAAVLPGGEERHLATRELLQEQDVVGLALPTEDGRAHLVLGERRSVQHRQLRPLVDGAAMTIDLDGQAARRIEDQLYATRVPRRGLTGLRLFDGGGDNLLVALPHLFQFVLPLAIGECYLELGQFARAQQWIDRASRYNYLNTAVELPLVWDLLAKTFLRWGVALLRQGDRDGARARFAAVARPGADPVDPTSPLYRSPTFDDIAAEVRAHLQGNASAPPSIAANTELALLNVVAIDSGVDVPLLSLSREQIPVFRYEYLQQVARYMAEQAIRAENAFIQFSSSAESERAQRRGLEDVAALADASVELEQLLVRVAEAQMQAAEAQRDSTARQRSNAESSRTQYENVSWDLKELDALAAEVARSAAADEISVNEGWAVHGLDTGTRPAANVALQVARRRGEVHREWELDEMARDIDNLAAAVAAAEANGVVTAVQEQAAGARRDVAALRAQQAHDQLAAFDSELFTPEVWGRLAAEVGEISREYLERAVVVAHLLEEVLSFELGEDVNVIRDDYASNSVGGLLAGQGLLSDIDSLELARIATLRKHHPIKEVISLAERYPFRFETQFRRTGRMEFTLDLADLDWTHAGTYQRKIRRVEVVVEGLLGPRGVNGTLTNTGFGLTRLRDGRVQLRLLGPETMPLSEYRVVEDAVVFPPGERELAAFELAPVATSWRLEIPPRSNDIDLQLISDVKLVVYSEGLFDPTLRDEVVLELLDRVPTRYQMTYDLGFEFADTFFSLADTGELSFQLTPSHLPYNHEQAVVERVAVYLQTADPETPNGLTLQVSSPDGTAAQAVTAGGGLVATSPGGPLEALTGDAVLGEWRISVPEGANQTRFAAGFTWAEITRVLFSVDYRYRRRVYPGDPALVFDDDFSANSLAGFEAIDDGRATQDGPGDWQHDPAGRIVQRAGVFGPAGASGTSPDKPGTYLVARPTAAVPPVRNALLAATVSNPASGAFGLVFRWIDADNFYFLTLDAARGFRRIGRKVAGTFSELAMSAVDLTSGFTPGDLYRLRVVVRGSELRAYVNGTLALSGRDAALAGPGRFGFYAWDSPGAAFHDLRVFEL